MSDGELIDYIVQWFISFIFTHFSYSLIFKQQSYGCDRHPGASSQMQLRGSGLWEKAQRGKDTKSVPLFFLFFTHIYNILNFYTYFYILHSNYFVIYRYSSFLITSVWGIMCYLHYHFIFWRGSLHVYIKLSNDIQLHHCLLKAFRPGLQYL